MKRISITGVCLTVAMAIAVIGVASASALPVFKATKFPVSFTSQSLLPLEPTLTSTSLFGNVTVFCKMTKDVGEIANATLVAKVLVDYTECKDSSGNVCTTNGAANGLIITKLLKGRPGYVNKATKLVGLELEPVSGKIFAEFNCASPSIIKNVSVEGCTIGHASPTNTSSKFGTLLFEENAAKNGQMFTEIEGGLHKPCEQTVKASLGTGKGWIMDKEIETFSENVELEA